MGTCKHKKRLQIYLDGWMDDPEAARFEKHLKKCSVCQSELLELEDVSSAALEIIDQAPENGYWDSFYSRTLNRIISRNVTPYEKSGESRKGLRLKIGSYSFAIVSLATILLLAANFLPDILSLTAERNVNQGMAIDRTEPVSIVTTDENVRSVEPDLPIHSEQDMPENTMKSVDSIQPATELVSVENEDTETPPDEPGSGIEILSYFRDNFTAGRPELILSDLSDYAAESAKTEYDKINEDYRLSSSMIVAGILSGADDENNVARAFDRRFGISLAEYGFDNFLNGASDNWGYLSMPDTGEAEEFRRYLIELELIQTK